MAVSQPNATIKEPDISQLVNNGVVYELAVHADEERNAIRAICHTVSEQGAYSLLFDHIVEASADPDVEYECPHAVHVQDRYFVVTWLGTERTVGSDLMGAWLDVEDLDATQTWTAITPITISDQGLYDVKQIHGLAGTSEYMLAYSIGSEIVVRRVNSIAFTGNVWNETLTTDHDPNILGVFGDGTITGAGDGGACVVYQKSVAAVPGYLVAHSLNMTDGGDAADVTIFSPDPTDGAQFANVGICRVTDANAASADPRVAVVAEYMDLSLTGPAGEARYAHAVVGVEVGIDTSPAKIGNDHSTYNLTMLSKPYAYRDAGGDYSVYCGLGYKTHIAEGAGDPGANWAQSVGFICDTGFQHWGAAANTVRPRPVANYNELVDARVAGASPADGSYDWAGTGLIVQARRANHLSNWIPGHPYLVNTRKSRTVVWPFWNRLQVVPNSGGEGFEPLGLTFKAITHVLEDPWTVDRDVGDFGEPTTNFHGCNHTSLYDNDATRDALVIAGGTPMSYDGQQIVELGFPWVPEIIDVAATAGGAMTASSTYLYVAVWEWTDSAGQLHRSGNGFPHSVDLGVGEGSTTLTIRTLTIGNREASWLYPNTQDVVLAIYRTRANSNTYLRLFSVPGSASAPANTPLNDPTTWMIQVVDDQADSSIVGGPDFRFAGATMDELPPEQPPASHVCAVWKNRVWLATGSHLWYSKEILPSPATGKIAPEFSSALRYDLSVVRGPVTGLQPLDDFLVVFSRDGVYSLQGDGADNLGQNATLILNVVQEGTGCIEPRSITPTPAGLVFQSYKGMYALPSDGAVDFQRLGGPIEDLVREAGNVRSGTHLEDRHVAAFVCNGDVDDEPRVLKWDYLIGQWSTAEIEPPNTTQWLSSTAGGCSWRGNERDLSHVVLCQGSLLIERGKDDATPFMETTDAGSLRPVRLDIETGWISLAQIAGVMRLYEIGTQLADSTNAVNVELDVDVDGDYSTASPEFRFWGVTDSEAAPNYLRYRPTTQKLSSFRLRVYEPSGMTEAADVKFLGATARVGIKRGVKRVGDAQIGRIP